ncbi:class I SAM-dependent methyltransferase [Micromonospora tarensis]|uniref:Class I SAM-dependent methyltransferase n=1 Tax=Micromonospora tarensis TaxID=2806100 RepID=A0ABS1YG57_9ACTN|nr:class I SAM-dependent methyltransferase [Micromonospora tarensis]MBM0276386.1 class I SAM-dependent methyltransferase [Micromonospora tarensis]
MTEPPSSLEPVVSRRSVSGTQNRAASRSWWDADADGYQEAHGPFLGDVDLVWCPEGLREADARLLGDVKGSRVLELGCGAAAGSRWLDGQGADVTALDLSSGMLRQARKAASRSGVSVPLVQADALAMPFPAETFDTVHTAFGAVPFITDTEALMREVFRVLRAGGAWVFATYHPMRWVFLDEPSEAGLMAVNSYFDRRPYVEQDTAGVPTYIEQHRTFGDHVRSLTAAGFILRDVLEPEWPPGHEEVWGQWSPMRGRLFPGTAIFIARRPAAS